MKLAICAILAAAAASTVAEPSPAPLAGGRRAALNGSPAPTSERFATFAASSRFWIDRNNLTFTLASDEPLASIGAADDFNDNIGSLKATAVLVKTGFNPDIAGPFIVTRCDFLLFKIPGTLTDGITNFQLTLFSDNDPFNDDPASDHYPQAAVRMGGSGWGWGSVGDGVVRQQRKRVHVKACLSTPRYPPTQITTPIALTSLNTPLLTYRSIWYQQGVIGQWPDLNQSTYYWVVLSPTTRMNIFKAGSPVEGPSGAIWGGMNAGLQPQFAPPLVNQDPHVFTARFLRSQPAAGNTALGCNTQAALNFINGGISTTNGWELYGGSRYGSWQGNLAGPSPGGRIVYGISLLGYQQIPSVTSTASGACMGHTCAKRVKGALGAMRGRALCL
jgi:hypothetical protein